MNISIVSLFPRMYDQFLETSLIKRAQDNGCIDIQVSDLFSYCAPKERADGATFGPGSGMAIRPEVVERAVDERQAQAGNAYKIFFSPHGTTLNQDLLHTIYTEIQDYQHIAMFPARYEGMDDRIEQVYADRVLSIGNYVLMGGDLPAMVFLEGILRFLPGVVGKTSSVLYESFMGPFVDYPEYTRPVTWKGVSVPDVVRSGDHQAIQKWRMEQSVQRTVKRHFSWLARHQLTDTHKEVVRRYIPPHYLVVMHTDVVLPTGEVGETSITSIDMHDIARSARTYGVENVFIVTPLEDQQKIVRRLLTFWQEEGRAYNMSRQDAVARVELAESFDSVISKIRGKHNVSPCVIATTAHAQYEHTLTYYDQETVWSRHQPVACILGTARGLSNTIIEQSTYVFDPIEGMTDFNHLSVRSAAAVMLDRWLGIRIKHKRTDHGIDESK